MKRIVFSSIVFAILLTCVMLFHHLTKLAPISALKDPLLRPGARVSGGNTNAPRGQELLKEMLYNPPEYRTRALSVFLGEVNSFIKDVNLDEPRPLVSNDLREANVASPFMTTHAKMFAVVKTQKYVYSAAISNKLCFIGRAYATPNGYGADLDAIRADGAFPMALVRTNEAVALAIKWLKDAHMDADKLNRDCTIDVKVWTLGDSFVPLYWIKWKRNENIVASVELVESTKALRSLRVNEDKYNLRSPLRVDDVGKYLTP